MNFSQNGKSRFIPTLITVWCVLPYSRLLCRIKSMMKAWWDFSTLHSAAYFFPIMKARINVMLKKIIRDYWTDDLISTEPEIWTFH